MPEVRDRVVELRRVQASELAANPLNWRRHPKAQREGLAGVLREVGFAGALLARQGEDGRLILIDGHLRAELAPDAELPVLVLDVDEAEAALILATHDPLGAMAETDPAAFRALLEGVSSGDAAVQMLLAMVAEQGGALPEEEPKPIPLPADERYKEQFGVIVICQSEAHQQEVYEHLRSLGYECKVVVT